MATIIDTLIYDRTPEESDTLAELNELRWGDMTSAQQATWLEGRGAYNYTDINRVINACNYLVNTLEGMGYTVPGYVPQARKTVNGSCAASFLQQNLANVTAIKKRLDYAILILPLDITNGMSTEDANVIENVLVSTNTIMELIRASDVYSGQVFSGQLYSQFGG